MRLIWIAVCCSIFCLSPGLAFAQPPAQFESLLASAQQAQSAGDFQTAAEFYRQAVGLHPEIPELRANLGLMYYQTGKSQQAIDAFGQALHLKPGLFVPNLFLGLEYVRSKRFDEAIPYLKRAAVSKPTDIQAQLALGHAYDGSGKSRLAIASFSRAVQLEPGKAYAWFYLGVSYLEQVESDARVLLAEHKNSVYLQALVAENYSDEKALAAADDAYKKLLALPAFPPDTHASYGFVLVNRRNFPEAKRELDAELASNPGALMAKLGLARLHAEQGSVDEGAKEIGEIWKADAGFLRTNAALFSAGLGDSKRSELERILEQRREAGEIPEEIVSLFQAPAAGKALTALSKDSTASAADRTTQPAKLLTSAEAKFLASGRYGECDGVLNSRFQLLQAKDLRVLAFCAYSTGDFRNAFDAGAKLSANTRTEAEGLYWETRSSQKLAAQALTRASEMDSASTEVQVLLGDLYRQRMAYVDAEREYRKALALRPNDPGAQFGLCLTLLADSDVNGAFRLAQEVLNGNPDDPELNAVMGEILCTQGDFARAEAYLKKGLQTKPELVPHVHVLLGKVYAETGRSQEAIAELKLALADDKDGRTHYQLGRLYLKVGDPDSAKRAFEVSERIRQEGITRAAISIHRD